MNTRRIALIICLFTFVIWVVSFVVPWYSYDLQIYSFNCWITGDCIDSNDNSFGVDSATGSALEGYYYATFVLSIIGIVLCGLHMITLVFKQCGKKHKAASSKSRVILGGGSALFALIAVIVFSVGIDNEQNGGFYWEGIDGDLWGQPHAGWYLLLVSVVGCIFSAILSK